MTLRLTSRTAAGCLACGLALAGLTVASSHSFIRSSRTAGLASTSETDSLRRTLARLPLAFEANRGQTDSRVRYLSRGPGYTLFLTGDEAVLRLRKVDASDQAAQAAATVRMRLQGANRKPVVEPEAPLPGRTHYYLGNNPASWRSDVERYARVRYESVYPGVDLVYYGREGELEYDYIVQPGADPGQIRLQIEGAEGAALDAEGNLLLRTPAGVLRQQRPFVYQEIDGAQQQVAGRYLLAEAPPGQEVGISFALGSYDRSRPLVIDPVLSYSTYLGGSGADLGTDIEVDAEGYIYVTGRTASVNFPVANPLQGYGGGTTTSNDGTDTFVSKLTPAGDALVFSTYLGGSGLDLANGLSLDPDRGVYIAGQTSSYNFPTQTGVQPTYGGGTYDAFLTKLDSAGLLVFSTYLGGAAGDIGWTVLHDGQGSVFLGGSTYSLNFPTQNALQATHANTGTNTASLEDAFITKVSRDGAVLQFSTYLGGTGRDSCQGLALDPGGNLCVGGDTTSTNFPVTAGAKQPVHAGRTDAFYTKLTADGAARLYATFFGGNYEDRLYGFGTDGQGNIYLSGFTFSTNLPTTFGAIRTVYQGGNSDGFLAKLNAAGDSYAYVTYLGGSGSIEYAYDVAPDSFGNVYVAGFTDSYNFPLASPYQEYSNSQDIFVMRLDPTGRPLYSTYLGGMHDNAPDFAYAIAADAAGNAYITGRTYARNWPLVNPLQAASGGPSTGDAFVVKLSPLHTTAPDLFQARALSPTEALLSWNDRSDNEIGFSLERSTNAVNYSVLANLPPDTTSYVDPGRNPGSTYWYRLRAFNGEGYTNYASGAVTMPTDPPAAPTNLTVTAVSSSVLRLTWTDNSNNETRFDVYRSSDGGANFAIIQYLGANVTTYDDQNLAPDTVYHYIVYASNTNANTPSNTASGRTLPNPPAAPNGLGATAVSASQINLSWTDASTNEAGFRLEQSSDGTSFGQIAELGANATSYQDSGLAGNTSYTYRVRAFNAGGNSGYSTTASALTYPVAPSGLAGQAPSGTRVELSWTDGNTTNPAEIEVERAEGGSATFTRIATAPARSGGYADTSAQENRTYQYRIRAVNATGPSAYTDPVTVTTPLDPPMAPTTLTGAYSPTYRRVNLTWTDRSANEAGFQVERSSDGGASWAFLVSVGANVTHYGDTAWQPDATHSYRVRAFNRAGTSAYSNTIALSMPPAPPSGLAASAGDAGQIRLSWTDHSSTEDAFVIERKGTDGSWQMARVVAANSTQATDLDLASDTAYTYRVRARNGVDVSDPSNEASARTLPDPPTAPNGLTVRALAQGELQVSWTDHSSNEDGFRVEVWNGTQFEVVGTVGANVTTYTHTGLAANTYYIHQVQAYNAGGLSGSVQTVGVYTLPATPANLQAQVVSATEVALSWTDTNPNPSGHEIERSTDGVSFSHRAQVTGGVTTFHDTGLAAGTTYYYRVRAVNGAGPSPYSNVASAATPVPTPPAAPSNLTGTALSATQVRLTWRDNSANETEFRIERSTNGKRFTQIATVGANVTQFTSTGLSKNTRYWFRVRAANAVGTSAYSNTVQIRTPRQ